MLPNATLMALSVGQLEKWRDGERKKDSDQCMLGALGLGCSAIAFLGDLDLLALAGLIYATINFTISYQHFRVWMQIDEFLHEKRFAFRRNPWANL